MTKMEFAVVLWTYCALLMVSTRGYVLDRKARTTLQTTNLKQTNENNDSGHLAVVTRSNSQDKTNSQDETNSFPVTPAEELENDNYDDNGNDFMIATEEGTRAESSQGERRIRQAENCQEPDEDQLEEMLLLKLKAPNNGNIDEIIGGTYTTDTKQCDMVRGGKVVIGSALNRRATCPWKAIANKVEARYPETIWYAECDCQECNNNQGRCTPLMQPQNVLYRDECMKGVYQYKLGTVEVSVGCVCSRYSSVPSAKEGQEELPGQRSGPSLSQLVNSMVN